VPLDKHDRAELDAFKGDVVQEVREIKEAAVRDCEAVIAPFRPLAQDVAQLKTETAKQTPIIMKLEKESKRAAHERKKRAILDEERARDAAKWKKRYRAGLAVLGAIAAVAEIYRALKGHG
jgi:hypothetical protein